MSELWGLVADPLATYGFMRTGVAVAAIVGLTTAVLSCLLVVRRQSLLGDAISHSVLLGVALGWLAAGQVGLFWGALAAGTLTGLAVAYIERNSRIRLDAAMGIVFTTAFALGLAIISVARPRGIDLFHVLFGNVLGVTTADLWLTATSGGIVVGLVLLLFRDFRAWSFDPVMARALGVPTRFLHYLFTALLSAAIVASLQAVGLVLVIAMLVIPGATAYLLVERLATMTAVAAVLGLLAGIGGLYTSFYVDVASGPSMVLTASALFLVVFLAAPRRGLVVRALRRRRAGRRAEREDLLKVVCKADHAGQWPLGPDALAARSELDPAALRRGLRSLRRAGLLQRTPAGLGLTDEGRRQGLRLVRTHRLLESYLHDAEGLGIEEIHDEADRLEHDVDAEVIEDIAGTLGSPPVDPHGHPIPSAAGELARVAGRPLSDARPGQRWRIAMVSDDRTDLLRAMAELGVLPGRALTVVAEHDDGLLVELDGAQMEIPELVAARVHVVPAAAHAPLSAADTPHSARGAPPHG